MLPVTSAAVASHLAPVRPDCCREGHYDSSVPAPGGGCGGGTRPVSVLVADPYPVVRAGVRAVLDAEPDLRVVGEAGDGPTALSLAVVLNPDMVVLEASLPGMGGVQLAARLRETRPEQKVLALTACEDAVSVRLLLSVGAQGYALKRSPTQQLLQAVRAVAAGGTHVDPAVAAAVAETPAPALSGRELQVLRLIALGYSNKEIGVRLKVSVKTIETHKTRAMEKLDLRGRVALVRYAAACGWLDEPPEPREQSAPPTS